ncbi:hypothetical protein ACHAXS_007197 [Conticribra weissflogii]
MFSVMKWMHLIKTHTMIQTSGDLMKSSHFADDSVVWMKKKCLVVLPALQHFWLDHLLYDAYLQCDKNDFDDVHNRGFYFLNRSLAAYEDVVDADDVGIFSFDTDKNVGLGERKFLLLEHILLVPSETNFASHFCWADNLFDYVFCHWDDEVLLQVLRSPWHTQADRDFVGDEHID